MSSFDFNAPQFVNFSDVEDSKADMFFDISEQQIAETNGQLLNPLINTNETTAYRNPNAENEVQSSTLKGKDAPSSKRNFTVSRKVLHEIVNHQLQSDPNIPSKEQGKTVIRQFEDLQLSDTKLKKSKKPLKATEVFSGVKCKGSEKKPHSETIKIDAMSEKSSKQLANLLHSNDSSDHHVSSTSKFIKSASVKRNASPLNSPRKFISLAEQVEHFYKDTPDRYRSKPMPIHKTWVAKPNCVPKTPNLITKYRQRKVNFPDEKQREEMELEEIKKHQIKAHPLNEKILMGPCLNLKAPITKKPVTVPQPFSLTEVKKKEPPSEPVFHFKAQPVPSTILNGTVGIPPKKVLLPTIPTTPHIKVPSRLRVEVKSQEKNSNGSVFNLPRNTKVEPFSFDARMRDLLEKKEEFVKKVIEEEKKTFSSFKAQPMPDFKIRNEQTPKIEKVHHKTIPQPFNLTQTRGNKSFTEDQNVIKVTPFKARPAIVIHQKPFMPKIEKHEVQFPCEFHLKTEKRAAERQKFDEKIKQKEEEYFEILKFQKEEEERLERKKMLEMRKKTEFKATPMPRYKAFEIHASDPFQLTLPQSPMFSSKTRKTTV